MKKFLITCFYLTLTLAVCAAGFLLPSTLNAYQDRQIFAKIEHTAMEPPELAYSSSLYDTLRLLSRDHYFVEYPSTGSKRTEDEIYTIVAELMEKLKEYGLLLPDSDEFPVSYSATLQLAIVSDGYQYTDSNAKVVDITSNTENTPQELTEESALDITTAVVWSCSVILDAGYWIDIWIDDKSGKAVACSMLTEQTLQLTAYDNEKELEAFVNTAARFLEDYFELPATLLQRSVVESYNPLFEKGNSVLEANYTIQLKEEDGTMIQLPLQIFPEYIILN